MQPFKPTTVATFREPIGDQACDSWTPTATPPLPCNHPNVEKAIELLRDIDGFDGETMEYIISEMYMREQMLKQLIGTCDWADVHNYYHERRLSSEY